MPRLPSGRAVVPLAACAVFVLALGSPQLAQEAAPSHLRTWLPYGASHLNESLPPAYMAAHADFAEMDASQPEFANRYKAAGGARAVMYTDPAYVPYCVPPFAPPAGPCRGPIGNARLPEDAWLHGPDGERIHRADSYTHEYQEALNPASPAARAAFREFTQAAAAQARVDLFFADDSGSTPRGHFYRFDARAVELAGDAQFIAAEKGLLAAAVRPLILNGNDPVPWLPAFDGAFLDADNVAGENTEGCFVASWYRVPLADDAWRKMADEQLAITRRHRLAVCMMQGEGMKDPATRLYGLASWWLTYDPQWSVIAPMSPGSDGASPAGDAGKPRAPRRASTPAMKPLRYSCCSGENG